MQPLAPAGASYLQANTNLSNTVSLSLLDKDGNEVRMNASVDEPIMFFIPRDSSLILPVMELQNVTLKNTEQAFHLNVISLSQFVINSNLTVSLHFEIRPSEKDLSYLFIYKFDGTPQLNSLKNDIDDWYLFCPKSKY